MGRLRRLVQASSNYLEAGIHENCIISKYQSTVEGGKNKQCFFTFVKLDDKNKEVGRKEISFFVFDPNGDYVYSNLQEMMLQVVTILEVYYTPEEVDTKFLPFRNTEIKQLSDVEDQIKRKSELTKIFDNVREDLDTLLSSVTDKFTNGDFSNQVRLKLIYKNNYVNQPNYGNFVEAMTVDKKDSTLSLSVNERAEIEKSEQIYKAAATGGDATQTAEVKIEKEKKTSTTLSALDTLSTDTLMTEL